MLPFVVILDRGQRTIVPESAAAAIIICSVWPVPIQETSARLALNAPPIAPIVFAA